MTYYRLYFMHVFSGHIDRFEEIEADDDSQAVATVETKQGSLALELWCSHRKVARFEPIDLASQLLAERRHLKSVKALLEPTPEAADEQQSNRSA